MDSHLVLDWLNWYIHTHKLDWHILGRTRDSSGYSGPVHGSDLPCCDCAVDSPSLDSTILGFNNPWIQLSFDSKIRGFNKQWI